MQRLGTPYRDFDSSDLFDAIVIGSGISGLATAALLAKHRGKRVLVLEQHYMVGGFTHVYRRHGYEWDVGVHYLGELGSDRSPVKRLFDHVGDGSLEWASMGEVYDRIILGDQSFDFVTGRDHFTANLKQWFPHRQKQIDRYMELIDTVGRTSFRYWGEKALPKPLAAIGGSWARRPFMHYARQTTRQVLEPLLDDPTLMGVVTGQWGDYGLPPGQSSFAMHSVVARHYLRGGFYPVGGSSSIAASIIPIIEDAGGVICNQADVDGIETEGNRAVGVRMADGRVFRSDLVISSAGIHNTWLKLVPEAVLGAREMADKARGLKRSIGHLCAYAGLKGSVEEFGLPKTNLWMYPSADHDGNVAAYLADPKKAPPLAFASFPSAKDPTFAERYPDRQTIELVTLAPYAWFEPWKDQPWRKRGEEYEGIKEAIAERMVEALYRQLPHLRGKIDYMEVSSPLSTQHFGAYQEGEVYGLDHSPKRFEQRWLRPQTPIRGLYLTGQDITTCGVTSALASGYLTASAICRRNFLKQAFDS